MDKFERLLESIDIPVLNTEANFWLIRTKKGFFYDEFIEQGYIALGWNTITKDVINITKTDEEEKAVLDKLATEYNEIKQSRKAYNKCKRFISEIKENDIIMFPSSKNDKITFALAGEYYEDENSSYEKEIEVIAQIDGNWDEEFEIKCPYKKRRKITVLRTVSGDRMNPYLYRALVSYHGISRINDYAEYILSSVYNIYYNNGEINYTFNVEKQSEINPITLSQFIIDTADIAGELLGEVTDMSKLNGKININSPGDVLLVLKDCMGDAATFLMSNKMLIAALWLSISGGKLKTPVFEYEVKSLLDHILSFREQNNKFKNDNLNRRLLERKINSLALNASELEINQENIDKIIDFSKYIKKSDE